MQGRVIWLFVGGAALIVGIIAWQLLNGSYKNDIAVMCNAEAKSGLSVAGDQKKLNEWVSGHLDTPQGNVFFNDLVTKPMGVRATSLRQAAMDQKLDQCGLVDAYEKQQKVADYQRDLTALCASDGDMPGLKYLDDTERTTKIIDWLATKAKSPQMKTFGAKLMSAPPPERAAMLRAEGNAASVYVCSLVDIISAPVAERPNAGAFVQMSTPQVNGDLTPTDVMKAIAPHQSEIEACYKAALAKNPSLVGKLLERIELAPKGKAVKIDDAGFVFDKEVSACVHKTLQAVTYPVTTSVLSIISIPMDFQPPKPQDPSALGPGGEE